MEFKFNRLLLSFDAFSSPSNNFPTEPNLVARTRVRCLNTNGKRLILAFLSCPFFLILISVRYILSIAVGILIICLLYSFFYILIWAVPLKGVICHQKLIRKVNRLIGIWLDTNIDKEYPDM